MLKIIGVNAAINVYRLASSIVTDVAFIYTGEKCGQLKRKETKVYQSFLLNETICDYSFF